MPHLLLREQVGAYPPRSGIKKRRQERQAEMAHVLSFGPLAVNVYLWLPFLPFCAQRCKSHHSCRAGWQLPGLTLAHGAQQEGRGLVPLGK